MYALCSADDEESGENDDFNSENISAPNDKSRANQIALRCLGAMLMKTKVERIVVRAVGTVAVGVLLWCCFNVVLKATRTISGSSTK